MKVTLENEVLRVEYNGKIFTHSAKYMAMLCNDPHKVYVFDYYPEWFTISKVALKVDEGSINIEFELIAKLPYV